MFKSAVLETRAARSIARKAGLRALPGEFFARPGLLYTANAQRNSNFFSGWLVGNTGWGRLEGVLGLWPPEPTRVGSFVAPYGPGGQFSYTDTRGIAYARCVVTMVNGFYAGEVAFAPVYCRNMNPLGNHEDEDPTSLSEWFMPDGHTLYEWHTDHTTGGPHSFTWPPKGSCVYTPLPGFEEFDPQPSAGVFAGRWAPPPVEALEGQGGVLIGVAVLSRMPAVDRSEGAPLPLVDVSMMTIQSVEGASDTFLEYFAGQIDD